MIPSQVNWIPQYINVLPQRTWGDPIGDCDQVAQLYGMEMRNILQGGPPIQLSELDLFWQQRHGVSSPGVCRESLWPFSLTFPTSAIPDPYNAQQSAINTPPNDAAVADRVNFVITDVGNVYSGDPDTFLLLAKTEIASGYPIILYVPPSHVVCFEGYDDSIHCFLGLDGRSSSPGTFFFDYSNASASNTGFNSIRGVDFNTASLPPPTGNTPMITDIISIATAVHAVGDICTQAQKDAMAADVAAIVPVSSTQILVPPATSVTDPTGAVWTLGSAASQYGFPVLRNGVQFASGQGTLISLKNGQIKVQNNLGNWYYAGTVSWSNTTPP